MILIYCADSGITIGSDPIIIWQLVLQAILRAWPEIADMNDLNSVIRVIKKLYRESMENFQQSLTLLCGSLLATFVDV